ncbi:MAG: hypothetical protein K1X28_03865 [Parachlamydiales bacterium]|nr:hypothetical protein [Parachlamydiales bacterium]
MFWRGESLSHRMILTLGLFLIGTLHTLIFSIFQIPKNFLMGHESIPLATACKVILYSFAIIMAFSHQFLCRTFGLRKTLYFGLLCNLLGLATLIFNQHVSQGNGLISLIVIDMLFFGLAITSVINGLVTYIIIEFPKRVGMGIVALFAFFNLGPMSATLLIELFQTYGISTFLNLFLIGLVLLSIWFVHVYFFNPPINPEKIHLRRGGIIWKELHYRLGLFMIAIIAYGYTETTFNLWGYIELKDIFGSQIADQTIPFFWMFLIVGQVFLLLPLYFIPAKRVFYFLVVVVAISSFCFPIQEKLAGFISWLVVAGFGCSAVFPILLSQMEKEILPFAHGSSIMPYIEKSLSLMMAGYFIGVGIVDIWVELLGGHPYFSLLTHFHMAAATIFITAIISIFLDLTAPKTR